MRNETNACGVIGLTFSIISIFFCSCCGIGIPLGITAFILSIIGLKHRNGEIGTAIAGLILSILGTILSSIIFLLMIGSGGALAATTKAINDAFSY